MVKILKPGKVALVTRGRFAGKKVVILQNVDQGSKSHPFGHAVVAGVERYPLKVTKSMGAKRIAKRSRVKPFIKVINYNHLMPTRYALELDNLKGLVTPTTFSEPSQRSAAKKTVKKTFEEKYQTGKSAWFFTPLRF
ncbi:60S ribosomal protein L27-A [Schizosaccharomyces pombe]